MEQYQPIILDGIWIDSMAGLQEQLLKAMGFVPAQVRPGHFVEDLGRLMVKNGRPKDVLWKDYWLSCQKMRHTLVPLHVNYIVLPPGHSNMEQDAVNGDADVAVARHHEESQAPLNALLAEIKDLFAQLGLRVSYEKL